MELLNILHSHIDKGFNTFFRERDLEEKKMNLKKYYSAYSYKKKKVIPTIFGFEEELSVKMGEGMEYLR